MFKENKKSIRHSISTILVWTILIAIGANYNLFMRLNAGQIQESEEFNWVEVKKAYDAFLNYPDEKNAYTLSILLPNKRYHFSDGKLAEEVTSYMLMDWSNYRILECEALFGNYYAAEAIYKLINISDGASTETLLDSLSTLIRIKPENLLRVLYENGWDNYKLEGIMHWALFLGDHSGDAYIYNYSMRIKAIESVSDPRFDYLKKRCISILQEEIEDIKKYREK